MGPSFTALARGDVSLATGLMVILAGLSAVLAPLLLTMLLGWLAPASDLPIDYLAIAMTLRNAAMRLGLKDGFSEDAVPRLSDAVAEFEAQEAPKG